METAFFISGTVSALESILSNINMATSAFFQLVSDWFTLSPFFFLVNISAFHCFIYVSFKQQIVVFYFLIQCVNLS